MNITIKCTIDKNDNYSIKNIVGSLIPPKKKLDQSVFNHPKCPKDAKYAEIGPTGYLWFSTAYGLYDCFIEEHNYDYSNWPKDCMIKKD